MHRLTQLIKASGSLLNIMERLHKWSDSNFQLICRHSISLDLMEHMLNMFNGTRCVAEIFHLMAVNLDQCKTAYRDYLDKSDNKYTAHENKELVIGEPRRYIPLLETQINHYRCLSLLPCRNQIQNDSLSIDHFAHLHSTNNPPLRAAGANRHSGARTEERVGSYTTHVSQS